MTAPLAGAACVALALALKLDAAAVPPVVLAAAVGSVGMAPPALDVVALTVTGLVEKLGIVETVVNALDRLSPAFAWNVSLKFNGRTPT